MNQCAHLAKLILQLRMHLEPEQERKFIFWDKVKNMVFTLIVVSLFTLLLTFLTAEVLYHSGDLGIATFHSSV